MFDFGFTEILLIAVVALLVLGPDKMPAAVRTISLWIGRMRRSFNNIKRDIEKEIGADDIRRQLRNEEIMARFDSTKQQVNKTIESVKSQTDSIKDDLNVKKQFDDIVKGPDSGTDDDKLEKEETKLAADQPAQETKNTSTEQNDQPVADDSGSEPEKPGKQGD